MFDCELPPPQGAQDGFYELIAGATLVEAVHTAMAIDASSEYIREALKNGIPAAIILRRETPSDAMMWLTNNHNFFNAMGGSATSWLELLVKVPDCEGSWKDLRVTTCLSASLQFAQTSFNASSCRRFALPIDVQHSAYWRKHFEHF